MSVDIELRKAAAMINAGKVESARVILSDYLKDFPESDLAWLLMSYVLEDPRKQQASATRAYRLNPENKQAKARIDQLLQFQTGPRPEVTSDDFSRDFQSYNPDKGQVVYPELDFDIDQYQDQVPEAEPEPEPEEAKDPVLEQDLLTFPDKEASISMLEERSVGTTSIEERLASVTHGGEAPRRDYVRDYPEDSLLSDVTRTGSRTKNGGVTRKLTPKMLVGAVVLGGFLMAISYLGIKFLRGDFISAEDAQATAAAETQNALATNEVKGRLPATWTPTVTATIKPTSTRTSTPMPTPTQTMIPPNPTIGAEIEGLQQQVAEMRQLEMLEKVDTFMINRAKVRPILKDYYFSLAGAEEEMINSGRVLNILGLIDSDFDMETNILNALVDGVGGFYLHETNQIYVIGNQFSAVEKFIYSHEFGHALVDQNYDLSGMSVYPKCEGNEDRCRAIQALIEGDAILLMLQWLEQGTTISEYNEIVRYNPPTRYLPEQSPPPFAFRNSEFTYSEGRAFVEELYTEGGWTSVNQAYTQLPDSTEQILHPSKYFAKEQPLVVPEVALDTVLGAEWEQIQSNTLGEWFTYLILGYGVNPQAQLNEGDAVRAAEGWGGDHYQVFYNEETEDFLLVVHWKWDRPSDTNEFATGIRYYLENRFSSGEVVEIDRECWNGNEQVTCLYSGYQENLWIIAPSIELVDAIEEQYPDM
jgi:hypothetical protein